MADEDVKTLFADADGPPLGFDAAGIIERGGKIRRRRKRLAGLGPPLTTAAAVVAPAPPPRPAPPGPAGGARPLHRDPHPVDSGAVQPEDPVRDVSARRRAEPGRQTGTA